MLDMVRIGRGEPRCCWPRTSPSRRESAISTCCCDRPELLSRRADRAGIENLRRSRATGRDRQAAATGARRRVHGRRHRAKPRQSYPCGESVSASSVPRPELDKAREAHLAAIWNTAKAYPQPSPEQTTLYQQLIAEHLTNWPSGATSDQARSWLGQLCEGRRDWSAAVDAYRAISASSPLYEPAFQALARSYLAWLGELRGKEQPTEALATTAATFFEQAITRGLNRWPEKWSRAIVCRP